ncbi:hypothetical protein YTPLAS18_18000 [Nitrospira sp.]|nr:hypothetical protein YTPLAS18_18000 [Nitrospira sp.]
MNRRYFTDDEFRKLVQEGTYQATENDVVTKAFPTSIEILKETDRRRVKFKITSSAVDRDRDVIDQDGLSVDNYLRNPVVLFGHDYRQPPIGKTVSLTRQGNGWIATADFMGPEISPFADSIFQMIKGGYLKSASIGFRPKKYFWNNERGGLDIEEAELLEWSVVSVPANPDALVQLSVCQGANCDRAAVSAWLKGNVCGCRTFSMDQERNLIFDDEEIAIEFDGSEEVVITRAGIDSLAHEVARLVAGIARGKAAEVVQRELDYAMGIIR